MFRPWLAMLWLAIAPRRQLPGRDEPTAPLCHHTCSGNEHPQKRQTPVRILRTGVSKRSRPALRRADHRPAKEIQYLTDRVGDRTRATAREQETYSARLRRYVLHHQ